VKVAIIHMFSIYSRQPPTIDTKRLTVLNKWKIIGGNWAAYSTPM